MKTQIATKRAISFVLVLCMLLTMAVPVWAVDLGNAANQADQTVTQDGNGSDGSGSSAEDPGGGTGMPDVDGSQPDVTPPDETDPGEGTNPPDIIDPGTGTNPPDETEPGTEPDVTPPDETEPGTEPDVTPPDETDPGTGTNPPDETDSGTGTNPPDESTSGGVETTSGAVDTTSGGIETTSGAVETTQEAVDVTDSAITPGAITSGGIKYTEEDICDKCGGIHPDEDCAPEGTVCDYCGGAHYTEQCPEVLKEMGLIEYGDVIYIDGYEFTTTKANNKTYYVIDELADFRKFCELISKGSYTGNFMQTTNISWDGVHDAQYPGEHHYIANGTFSGEYDGQGYTLDVGNTSWCIGLFKKLSNATIRNVRFTGEMEGGYFEHGIAGEMYNSNIFNCINDLDLYVSSKAEGNGWSYIGAMCSIMNNSTIDNCAFTGSMGVRSGDAQSANTYKRMVESGTGSIENFWRSTSSYEMKPNECTVSLSNTGTYSDSTDLAKKGNGALRSNIWTMWNTDGTLHPAYYNMGTIGMSGTAQYGEQLKISVYKNIYCNVDQYRLRLDRDSSLIKYENLTYGTGTDSYTYTITEEDIEKVIKASLVPVNGKEGGLVTVPSPVYSNEVKKAPNTSTPSGLNPIMPNDYNNTSGRIDGLDNQLEYQYRLVGSTGTGWITVSKVPGITGLKAGNYEVRFKETATHNASEAVTVPVPARIPADPPTNTAIAVTREWADGETDAEVTLSFGQPDSMGSGTLDHYEYRLAQSEADLESAAIISTSALSNPLELEAGRTWYAQVRAVTDTTYGGLGIWSDPVMVQPKRTPFAPDAPTVISTAGGIRVTIPKVEAVNNGGEKIASYTIHIYDDASCTNEVQTDAGRSANVPYDISLAAMGAMHYVKVAAVNSLGEGNLSKQAEVFSGIHSMTVETKPEMSYIEGQRLDLSKLSVTVQINNEKSRTVSGLDLTKAGIQLLLGDMPVEHNKQLVSTEHRNKELKLVKDSVEVIVGTLTVHMIASITVTESPKLAYANEEIVSGLDKFQVKLVLAKLPGAPAPPPRTVPFNEFAAYGMDVYIVNANGNLLVNPLTKELHMSEAYDGAFIEVKSKVGDKLFIRTAALEVTNKVMTEFVFNQTPEQTEYWQFQRLQLDDLKIGMAFNDNTSRHAIGGNKLSEENIRMYLGSETEYDKMASVSMETYMQPEMTGQYLYFVYEGFDTEQAPLKIGPLTVHESYINEIYITELPKSNYYETEPLNYDGMVMRLVYNSTDENAPERVLVEDVHWSAGGEEMKSFGVLETVYAQGTAVQLKMQNLEFMVAARSSSQKLTGLDKILNVTMQAIERVEIVKQPLLNYSASESEDPNDWDKLNLSDLEVKLIYNYNNKEEGYEDQTKQEIFKWNEFKDWTAQGAGAKKDTFTLSVKVSDSALKYDDQQLPLNLPYHGIRPQIVYTAERFNGFGDVVNHEVSVEANPIIVIDLLPKVEELRAVPTAPTEDGKATMQLYWKAPLKDGYTEIEDYERPDDGYGRIYGYEVVLSQGAGKTTAIKKGQTGDKVIETQSYFPVEELHFNPETKEYDLLIGDGYLKEGQIYDFIVLPRNVAGSGNQEAREQFVKKATWSIPKAPEEVTVVQDTPGTIVVSWAAITGAAAGSADVDCSIENYTVYVSKNRIELGTKYITNDTRITISGLQADGLTTYVKVSATNAVGEGEFSNFASINVTGKPSAPVLIHANADDYYPKQINLKWQTPETLGGVDLVKHYLISYAPEGADAWTTPEAIRSNALQISHTVDVPEADTTYRFRIWAVVDIGQSEVEGEVLEFKASSAGRPGQVDASTIQLTPYYRDGVHGMNVAWTAPPDNSYPIDRYEVYYFANLDDADPVGIVSANTTQIDIDGLEAGKKYYFTVIAKNGQGNSQESERCEECSAIARVVTDIELVTPVPRQSDGGKIGYPENTKLSYEGWEFALVYSDGTSEGGIRYTEGTKLSNEWMSVNLPEGTYIGNNNSNISVVATYERAGVKVSRTVVVYALSKQIASIEGISKLRTDYIEKNLLDLSGAAISVVYDNGVKAQLSLLEVLEQYASANASVSISGYAGAVKHGETVMETEMDGRELSFGLYLRNGEYIEGKASTPYRVAERSIAGIGAKDSLTELEFVEKTALKAKDVEHMTAVLLYDNGETEEVTYGAFTDKHIAIVFRSTPDAIEIATDTSIMLELEHNDSELYFLYNDGNAEYITKCGIVKVVGEQISSVSELHYTAPQKSYGVGQALDLSDAYVVFRYTNGTTKSALFSELGTPGAFSAYRFDIMKVGDDYRLMERDNGRTLKVVRTDDPTIELTMEEGALDSCDALKVLTIESLALKSADFENRYVAGEPLDLTGLQVRALLSDSDRTTIDLSYGEEFDRYNFKVTRLDGGELLSSGAIMTLADNGQALKIYCESYPNVTITTVTKPLVVIPESIAEIRFTGEPTKSYVDNQAFQSDSLRFTVAYNTGGRTQARVEEDLTLTELGERLADNASSLSEAGITTSRNAVSITEGELMRYEKGSTQTLTVNWDRIAYDGPVTERPAVASKSLELAELSVTRQEIVDFEIVSPMTKFVYTAGDSLDLSGLRIKRIYNDGAVDSESEYLTVGAFEGRVKLYFGTRSSSGTEEYVPGEPLTYAMGVGDNRMIYAALKKNNSDNWVSVRREICAKEIVVDAYKVKSLEILNQDTANTTFASGGALNLKDLEIKLIHNDAAATEIVIPYNVFMQNEYGDKANLSGWLDNHSIDARVIVAKDSAGGQPVTDGMMLTPEENDIKLWVIYKAYDEGSSESTVLEQMTVPLTIIVEAGAVQNLRAGTGGTSVDLTWNAPADTGRGTILGYNVYLKKAGDAAFPATPVNNEPITASAFTLTELASATKYEARVTAINELGESSASAEASFTTVGKPGVPTNVKYALSSLAITWDAVVPEDGAKVVAYKIYLTNNNFAGSNPIVIEVDGTKTSYTLDPDIVPEMSTPYMANVSAVTLAGEGPLSNTSGEAGDTVYVVHQSGTYEKVLPKLPPAAPKELKVTAGDGQLQVNWKALNAYYQATGYTVSVYDATDLSVALTTAAVAANTTGAVIAGLNNGTEYAVTVYAQNAAGGNGEETKPVTATPQEATGVTVSGQVYSYNPGRTTTIFLYGSDSGYLPGQDNSNIQANYTITIAAAEGQGQATQDFRIDAVISGTYTLVVEKETHLTYTITNVVIGDTDYDFGQHQGFETLKLLCGDVDNSGTINSSDNGVITVKENFNKAVSGLGVNPLADLDGDGFINGSDAGIVTLKTNYNKGVSDCTFTMK